MHFIPSFPPAVCLTRVERYKRALKNGHGEEALVEAREMEAEQACGKWRWPCPSNTGEIDGYTTSYQVKV